MHLTLDEFCESRGVSRFAPSFPEMHRHPRRPSKASQRSASRRIGQEMKDWQDKRDMLRIEYNGMVERGDITLPSRRDRLERTAAGEGEAAEAARRILARIA